MPASAALPTYRLIMSFSAVSRRLPGSLLGLLLVFAFLARMNQEIVKPNNASDKAWQVNGSYNLLHGRGLARYVVELHDWSRTIREPLVYWPPGYSLLLALLGLAIRDLMLSALILQACAILFFLATVHLMARILGLDKRIYALILATLCLPGHFIDRFACTDLLALSAFQFAVLLTLYGLKFRWGKAFHVALGIAVFLPGLFRYAYYPIMFAIPLALPFIGRKLGEKRICVNGLLMGAGTGACLIGLSLINFLNWRTMWYMEPRTSSELHLNNLTRFNSFVFETFFNPEDSRLIHGLKERGWLNDRVFTVLSVLLTAMLLIAVWRFVRIRLAFPEKDGKPLLEKSFYLVAVFAVLLNVTSLIYLSLRCEPQTDWTNYWTYVGENRYFAPSMLCLLWCAALAATAQIRKREYIQWPLLLMAASLLYASVNLAMLLHGHSLPPLFRQPDDDLAKVGCLVRQMAPAAGKRLVVLAPFDISPFLALSGCEISRPEEYMDFISLSSIPTSQDLEILLWTGQTLSEEEENFIAISKAEAIAHLGKSTLYRIDARRNSGKT